MRIGSIFYILLTFMLISYATASAMAKSRTTPHMQKPSYFKFRSPMHVELKATSSMAQKPEPPVRIKKLLNASLNGDAQEVQLVIDKNKKCNQPLFSLSDNDGNTALHKVCTIGYIVRTDGTSAGRAVYDKADYPATLEILLKEGAKKTDRNIYKESASDILTKVETIIKKRLSTLESSQESRKNLLQKDLLTIIKFHELLQK